MQLLSGARKHLCGCSSAVCEAAARWGFINAVTSCKYTFTHILPLFASTAAWQPPGVLRSSCNIVSAMATWLVLHALLLLCTALPVGSRSLGGSTWGASAAAHADTACVSGTVVMK